MAIDQGGLPGDARRAVSRVCRQARTGAGCEASAVLLTSEVVTNAMVHGTGVVRLAVGVDDLVVRVEVGDDSSRLPRTTPAPTGDDDGLDLGGRGMGIVEALSSSWGSSVPAGGGKTVWFEVPTHP
ncbi:ATP-binding protein [Aquipuribacter hungaricus]